MAEAAQYVPESLAARCLRPLPPSASSRTGPCRGGPRAPRGGDDARRARQAEPGLLARAADLLRPGHRPGESRGSLRARARPRGDKGCGDTRDGRRRGRKRGEGVRGLRGIPRGEPNALRGKLCDRRAAIHGAAARERASALRRARVTRSRTRAARPPFERSESHRARGRRERRLGRGVRAAQPAARVHARGHEGRVRGVDRARPLVPQRHRPGHAAARRELHRRAFTAFSATDPGRRELQRTAGVQRLVPRPLLRSLSARRDTSRGSAEAPRG